MSSPLKALIQTFPTGPNRQGIEARLTDIVTNGINSALRDFMYNVPLESQETAREFSVPYFEDTVLTHSHPIHKNEFTIFHNVVLPTYIHGPTTIMQVKPATFNAIRNLVPVHIPLTLSNAILVPKDKSRFGTAGVYANSSTWAPITTPTAYMSDCLHHMEPSAIFSLFHRNPELKDLYARAIIPPESATMDFSLHPGLYTYRLEGDRLLYTAEGDQDQPYVQPISAVQWLTINALVGPTGTFTLNVSIIKTNGPWHVFLITRDNLLRDEVRSFRNAGFVTIPSVYRGDKGTSIRVPHKTIRSMFLYGKTVEKHERGDLYAKIRQQPEILELLNYPLDVILQTVSFVASLLDVHYEPSLETNARFGIKATIWHHTLGTIKTYTIDLYRLSQLRRFLNFVHFDNGDIVLKPRALRVTSSQEVLGLDTIPGNYYYHEDVKARLRFRCNPANWFTQDKASKMPRPHAPAITWLANAKSHPWAVIPETVCRPRCSNRAPIFRNSWQVPHPAYHFTEERPRCGIVLGHVVDDDVTPKHLHVSPFHRHTIDTTPCLKLRRPHTYRAPSRPPQSLQSARLLAGPQHPYRDMALFTEQIRNHRLSLERRHNDHRPAARLAIQRHLQGIMVNRVQPNREPAEIAALFNNQQEPNGDAPLYNDYQRMPNGRWYLEGQVPWGDHGIEQPMNAAQAPVPAPPAPLPPPIVPIVVPHVAAPPVPAPSTDISMPDAPPLSVPSIVVTNEDEEEQRQNFLRFLHECEDIFCPHHAHPAPGIFCTSGFPSSMPGPCHNCPQFRHPHPAGGASSSADGEERNYRPVVQHAYPTNISGNAQLDSALPRTIGKRHRPPFRSALAPMAFQIHPVTREDCLLRALIASGVRTTADHMWNILHQYSTSGTRQALITPHQMLTTAHLEILALYLGLNVHLTVTDPLLAHFTGWYGVNEGKTRALLLDNKHFTYRQDLHRAPIPYMPCGKIQGHANHRSKLLVKKIEDLYRESGKTCAFTDYTVSWPRAEALVRAMAEGQEGTLTRRPEYGKDYVKGMEACAKANTQHGQRQVQILVDIGEGGNGKSWPVIQAISPKKQDGTTNKFFHTQHCFQFVLYNNPLRIATAAKLDVRQKDETGQGTKSYFVDTWENTLTTANVCRVLIIDEITKFMPGYVDLLLALNTEATHVVILGDPKQNSHHTPTYSPLNDQTIHTPEDRYFAHYAAEYTIGTRRSPQVVANFMNIPTTSNVVGTITHAYTIPEGFTPVVSSSRQVLDISASKAIDAHTSSSAQGLDYDNVAIIINATTVQYHDVHMFWTALGRVKRNLCIVWQAPDVEHINRIILDVPYLNQLRIHHTTHQFAGRVDWFRLQREKMGSFLHLLRLPQRPWTNLGSIDFSMYPVHAKGGRAAPMAACPRFSELPAMTRVFYTATEPTYQEPFTFDNEYTAIEHLQATHTPREILETAVEDLRSAVREKFDREMVYRGNVSKQFPDRPARSKHNPKFPRTSFGLRQDGTVDTTLLSLHHTMKNDDAATTGAAIKKRVVIATPQDNQREYLQASVEGGPQLRDAFFALMKWDINQPMAPVTEDDLLPYNEYHESNRLKKKKFGVLKAKEKDAEPEKDRHHLGLSFKQEVKIKTESEGTDAKAAQTIITCHDAEIMHMGKVGHHMADMLLKHKPDNVYFHLKRSPADLNDIIKAQWRKAGPHLVNDFKAFDQSHDGAALYLFLEVMRHLGYSRKYIEYTYHQETEAFCWAGPLAATMHSGRWLTFLKNCILNAAFSNLKYHLDNLNTLILIAGDDFALEGLAPIRASYHHVAHLFRLESKTETTLRPEFVSWRITPYGIFKQPRLLLTRYLIHLAAGDVANVANSYFYEYSFAAHLRDRIYEVMNTTELEFHSILTSYFYRSRLVDRSILTRGTDQYVPSDHQHVLAPLEGLDPKQVSEFLGNLSRTQRRLITTMLAQHQNPIRF